MIACLFRGEVESIQHLFFDCLVTQEVWRATAYVFQFNSPHNMFDLSAMWCMILKNLWLAFLVLFTFGTYGHCEMMFVSRVQCGKILKFFWEK